MERLNDNSIVLCCGSRRCPILSVDGDKVTITDDYDQKVEMQLDQAKLIAEALEELTK